jgi:hypothetical protein
MVIHPEQVIESGPYDRLLDVTREIAGNRTPRAPSFRGLVPSKSVLPLILGADAQSTFNLEQQAEETFLRPIESRIAQTEACRTGQDIFPGGDFHLRSPSEGQTVHVIFTFRILNFRKILKIFGILLP